MVDRVCVKFGDPSRIGFLDIMWKNRQTLKRRWLPYHVTAVGVGKQLSGNNNGIINDVGNNYGW